MSELVHYDAETASFAFTEARIGVAPAMISLTTQDLLTPRAAARYDQAGATFGVEEAAPGQPYHDRDL